MLNDNAKPNRMNLWFGLLLITASVFALSGLVHAKHPFFHLPSDFNLEMGASNEKRLQFEALNRQVNASNAMVVFAMDCALNSAGVATSCSVCFGVVRPYYVASCGRSNDARRIRWNSCRLDPCESKCSNWPNFRCWH